MKIVAARITFWALPFAAVLLLTPGAQARSQAGEPTPDATAAKPANGFGPITVKNASIVEIDSSHLRIAVDMAITPSRNVTIESLRLTALRLNGLPVYAEPLSEPIDLVKGKEATLPPVYVTIQARDLTSTAPLREIVVNQSAHVQGQIVANIKMNFLDKLAMHTEHPRILVPLVQDVPVAFGGTPFARQAALGVLTVIDLGLKGTSAVRKNVPGFESPWIHELEAEANADLLQVETSYVLKEHDTSYPVVLDQLGFRLASGQIITTAEAKAPWEYDPEFLGRIKAGEAKLVKKGFEVQLRSTAKTGADAAPLLLTNKDFTLEERGASDKDPLIVQKEPKDAQDPSAQKVDFSKIDVRRRAAPNALSVIVLQAPPATPGGFRAAPAAIAQQDRWEKVAVYRMTLDSAGKPTVEVVELAAHRDGQAIRLDQSVDPSFYGSPILVPEGVLGFVQDEQAGAFLPADIATAASAASGVAALASSVPASR
jgi:hypothetical protein